MLMKLRSIPACLASLLVLLPLPVAGRSAPDFSGNWVLSSATAAGAGRSSAGAGPQSTGERPTTSHTTSGAALNCGRACTIVQKAQTLRIENAMLASNTEPAPAVTLQLDGRLMSVINSFGRGGELPATATWSGDQLEIVTKPEGLPIGYKQSLTLDGVRLVVVTTDDQGISRVTLKYDKK